MRPLLSYRNVEHKFNSSVESSTTRQMPHAVKGMVPSVECQWLSLCGMHCYKSTDEDCMTQHCPADQIMCIHFAFCAQVSEDILRPAYVIDPLSIAKHKAAAFSCNQVL